MEKKKEMSFIEKFDAAGNEFEKEIKDGGAMIMIAIGELNEKGVSANIKGKSHILSSLLAYVACKDNGFKTILMNAIKIAENQEQEEEDL